MTDSDDLAANQAVSTAERIEDMDSPDELDPLDVQATVNLRGTVTDITLVLGTGGPHVELNVSNGTVTVIWGSDRHTTHVRNPDVLDELERRYRRVFEETVLQG